jgi:DNA-binding transcriptional MerR regulator
VSTGLQLGDYATTPLYNIKAVVQATGISPSTLRAWERRYNIARPQRSDNGYRLYAERDVAIIRWLKAQVDAGMSISQAVVWLSNIVTEAGEIEQTVLPMASNSTPRLDPLSTLPGAQREAGRDLATLQLELLFHLTHFDEEAAEQAMAEAFALYPLEQVGDQLLLPALVEVAERRRRGEVSHTIEHFASSYVVQRLGALLRVTPHNLAGTLIWVGSARTETHEAGALLLTIYLRRAGYHALCLGQNLPTTEEAVADLVQEVRRHQPVLIVFAACTQPTAEKTAHFFSHVSTRTLQNGPIPTTTGYSGPIYASNPELRAESTGVYLGTYAHEVVQNINELLADRHHHNRKHDKNGKSSTHMAELSAGSMEEHVGPNVVAKAW